MVRGAAGRVHAAAGRAAYQAKAAAAGAKGKLGAVLGGELLGRVRGQLDSMGLEQVTSLTKQLDEALAGPTALAERLVNEALGKLEGKIDQLRQSAAGGHEQATEVLEELAQSVRNAANEGYHKARAMLGRLGIETE